jgi:hypothetical protein
VQALPVPNHTTACVFNQGKVDPGEAVRLHIFILDVSPTAEFYLVLEPQLLAV